MNQVDALVSIPKDENAVLSDALSNRLLAEFAGWRFEKSGNEITAFFENDKTL